MSNNDIYTAAIEKLRVLHKDWSSTGNRAAKEIEEAFPELAESESEDERIRKELLAWLKSRDGQILPIDRYNAAIAWLEKQKEYESTDFDYVWEATDCSELTSALDKYSEDAIKKVCHAWYDKGIELERKNWLKKQGGNKPAVWSDEDEEMLKSIKYHLDCDNADIRCYGWLEELKDRVQPQPQWKPSDELDEASYRVGIKRVLENPKSYGLTKYNWKPSDEQIHYLSWVANIKLGDSVVEQEVSKRLNELLEQLKKLRED